MSSRQEEAGAKTPWWVKEEWELFDLDADPHELHSVAGEAEYADVRAELAAELARLQQLYNGESP